MQISIITIVLAFAMGINAAAWKPTTQSYQNKCGNTGKLSCCNPKTTSAGTSGLIALVTPILAGGTCAPVPVVGALGSASDICGGNTVSCCSSSSTQQLGLLNLSTTCSPLTL